MNIINSFFLKKKKSRKKKKTQKKKVVSFLIVLCLILMLSATYAWSSYTDWVRNHLESLGFDSGKVVIIEDFRPIGLDFPNLGEPNEIDEPKVSNVKKEVGVMNTTPVPAFVRVSFEEQFGTLDYSERYDYSNPKAPEVTYKEDIFFTEDNNGDPIEIIAKFPSDELKSMPIMMKPLDYYVENSEWVDKTDLLEVYETKGSSENLLEDVEEKSKYNQEVPDEFNVTRKLKLFVHRDNPERTILMNERYVANSVFPKNYDFYKETFLKIPVIPDKMGITEEEYLSNQDRILKEVQENQTRIQESAKMSEIYHYSDYNFKVAQQVTGKVDLVNGTYRAYYVYDEEYMGHGTDERNLKYWFFNMNEQMDSVSNTEFNWAGKNNFVNRGDYSKEPEWQTDFAEDLTVDDYEMSDYYIRSSEVTNMLIGFRQKKSSIIVLPYGEDFKDYKFTEKDKHKWIYNPNDGYYYYLSPIPSGERTQTNLMESLRVEQDPKQPNIQAYDLHIGAEAIPAQRSMLEVKSGGGVLSESVYDEKNKRDMYRKDGRVNVSNGYGFGLDKTDENFTNLYNFLGSQVTMEDKY